MTDEKKKPAPKKVDEKKPTSPVYQKVRAVWRAPENGVILVRNASIDEADEYRLLDAQLYNGSRIFSVPMDVFLKAPRPRSLASDIASVMPSPEEVQVWVWTYGGVGEEIPDAVIRSAATKASVSAAQLKRAFEKE